MASLGIRLTLQKPRIVVTRQLHLLSPPFPTRLQGPPRQAGGEGGEGAPSDRPSRNRRSDRYDAGAHGLSMADPLPPRLGMPSEARNWHFHPKLHPNRVTKVPRPNPLP